MMSFSLVLGTVERTGDLEIFLTSLDAQDYRDFELIVVDQNPDDRLVPILAPYAEKFPVVHLRCEKGLSRAKNLGLAHASRDIIGFPDDNCQLPEGMLREVARFFGEHPEVDGLTGRSADEEGRDSNGKFARTAGPVDKFNVWNRNIAFNIWLRSRSVRGVRFDEDMGPGAGTMWGAGDETDFLLQVLEKGAYLFYDPRFVVIHDQPVKQYDESARRRAYSYACGGSHAIKKHGFPLWFKVWWVARTLGRLSLTVAGRNGWPEVFYRWNLLKGKVRGLV